MFAVLTSDRVRLHDGESMAPNQAPFYQSLGQRLALARRKANLTQAELARGVGLSRTSITNIEKGRQPVQAYLLVALAGTLGVRVADLLPEVVQELTGTRELRGLRGLDAEKREWVTRVISTGGASGGTE